MISQDLEVSLHIAFVEARKKKHEFVTVEHLLLALLSNPSALDVLNACGADVERLRQQLTEFIDRHASYIAHLSLDQDTQPTLGFQRVIQRAILHVQASGKKEINGANVLVALFGEKDSHAVFFLNQEGLTRLDVVNFIAHGVVKGEPPEPQPWYSSKLSDSTEADNLQVPVTAVFVQPLDAYTQNLNVLAEQGKIDRLIGRSAELERVIQILCRRRKNNPLLIGEAGVGKTAVVEGLARHIVEGMVAEPLKKATIYALDMGSLLAGTKYRGDFEQRLKGVIKQLSEQSRAILFFDEIHTLIGAGAASGGTLDASNLIKPVLSSGQLRCIGATTFSEFRSIFERDTALSRRFQCVEIQESSIVDTIKILKGVKSQYEKHHGVRYTNTALSCAAELSAKYIRGRQLPDKALDVIDEAGAAQQLMVPSKQKKLIGRHEIEVIVAKIAKVPAEHVNVDDKRILQSLERDLKAVIFGQDSVIEALTVAIKTSRAGLGSLHKPVSSFLFCGPTGVGKTEVARQLAYFLGIELVRFDMSEYSESHAVARLIGSPPGYVGFDKGGLLTEAVSKTPYCVLLLDELEKAHRDIFNILLQVMDYGTLTDTNGRRADFNNAIIIITTNAGSETLQKNVMGFSHKRSKNDSLDELKKLFSAEFRNRLDLILPFEPLTETVTCHIVDKFLLQLEMQLQEKGVDPIFTPELKKFLCQKGFDPLMGARPLGRLIKDTVCRALADELLFGRLAKGGKVTVDINEDDTIRIIFNGVLTPDVAEQASPAFQPL